MLCRESHKETRKDGRTDIRPEEESGRTADLLRRLKKMRGQSDGTLGG